MSNKSLSAFMRPNVQQQHVAVQDALIVDFRGPPDGAGLVVVAGLDGERGHDPGHKCLILL